ncbi:MAG: hypothetical protein GY805_33165, partial [Chloroflexi bacterium]|nr:hypothetical protein [Chloroflexota bacterium]
MNNYNAYTKFLLIGLLSAILAACTSAIEATPTVLVAEVVTVSAERPFASATPQPSKTPTMIETATETAVAISTPQPIATAIATPYPSVSRPILSDQGQLAFIRNQTLFVETAVGSQDFLEVASFVNNGAWSNDGNKFAFYVSNVPNTFYNKDVALWKQQTNHVTYLSDL